MLLINQDDQEGSPIKKGGKLLYSTCRQSSCQAQTHNNFERKKKEQHYKYQELLCNINNAALSNHHKKIRSNSISHNKITSSNTYTTFSDPFIRLCIIQNVANSICNTTGLSIICPPPIHNITRKNHKIKGEGKTN